MSFQAVNVNNSPSGGGSSRQDSLFSPDESTNPPETVRFGTPDSGLFKFIINSFFYYVSFGKTSVVVVAVVVVIVVVVIVVAVVVVVLLVLLLL